MYSYYITNLIQVRQRPDKLCSLMHASAKKDSSLGDYVYVWPWISF